MFRRPERASKFYKDTFNSDAGKEVLADLMDTHGFTTTTFPGEKSMDGQAQALDMAFREGERNVILRILTLLEWGKPEIEVVLHDHLLNEHERGDYD